jgi:hypothetical protein
LRRQEIRRRQAQRRRLAAGSAIAAAGVAVAAVVMLATGSHAHSAPLATTEVAARSLVRHRPLPPTLSIGGSPRDTLPFAPNPNDRLAQSGEIPSLWADGLPCSVGCRPYGARLGWPLKPFYRQHPLRAGLNELRPGSLHVGLDIQARNGQRVYAVQPGIAQVLAAVGPDARVQVGNYVYWHIAPRVVTGQAVIPHETVLGTVLRGYGHIAFSEVNSSGDYVNPLRPGGIVLQPYVDHAPPEIAKPSVAAGGQVIVRAYDPQTVVRRTTYMTPVLAPAALAYRLYRADGAPVTPLQWAFGGAHLLPWVDRSLVYAPGARAPGYDCFATRLLCVSHWIYRVAGGFAPPLPPTGAAGRYRLTIYAWDWAQNVTALDTDLTMTPKGWRPVRRFPEVLFHHPGYFQKSLL